MRAAPRDQSRESRSEYRPRRATLRDDRRCPGGSGPDHAPRSMPRPSAGWNALSVWRSCVITTTAVNATDKRKPVNPTKPDLISRGDSGAEVTSEWRRRSRAGSNERELAASLALVLLLGRSWITASSLAAAETCASQSVPAPIERLSGRLAEEFIGTPFRRKCSLLYQGWLVAHWK